MPDREDDPGRRRATLAALYDAHAVGLYRYALMILANTAEAQDAVQQAFTKFMDRKGPAVLAEADYLRTSVRNECFTALRRRRRDRADTDTGPPLLEPVAQSTAKSHAMAVCLRIDEYRRARGGLPETLEALRAATGEKELPVDPFTGQSLRYRREDRGYVVYSVGEDGKDDGGAVVTQQGPVRDCGCRIRVSG